MDEYPQEHNKVMTYEYKLTKHSIILSIIMYIYMYVLKNGNYKLQFTIQSRLQCILDYRMIILQILNAKHYIYRERE